MSSQSLVKGTMILTVAIMLSKILGFIYVIPFTRMVGSDGFVLFEYAYKPYAVILILSTMGIPLAVSKFVSKYNGLGKPEMGVRLLYSGMFFLTFIGVISFGLLYGLAPQIASIVINPDDTTGNSIENVVYVIRMLSFALLIVPPMAIIRGFFQGNQNMSPTGISQVVEQIVRILIVIAGSFVMIHIFHVEEYIAVGFATFGTTIGAVVSCVVLYWYYRKNPSYFQVKPMQEKMSYGKIYKELLSYAIPFAIVSLATPVYQMIDTFTINQAMMSRGVTQSDAETVNALIGLVQKVIMIPVSLATAFAYTLVPQVTNSYTSGNITVLHEQMKKTYQAIFLLTMPAVCGLLAISQVAFGAMFGMTHAQEGGWYLAWYSPLGLMFSIFIVTAAMLQGINEHRQAVYSLLAGLVFKISLNYMFVKWYGGNGSTFATEIGFMISIVWNLVVLKNKTGFSILKVGKDFTQTIIACALMIVTVVGVDQGLNMVLEPTYTMYLVRMVVGIVIGALVYGMVIFRTEMFKTLFGNRISKFKKAQG
ncbi:polysaccharide biosynthesis protein [Bacillus luti]|nr:polysaccharide biosynthesis protein [Bacillus cereus]HDR8328452.1 polysaccharide biosynthesis protein [Bacillus cereus]HDR8334215.1 polysaccharide biosynthesis protein [Bacillus cereus]